MHAYSSYEKWVYSQHFTIHIQFTVCITHYTVCLHLLDAGAWMRSVYAWNVQFSLWHGKCSKSQWLLSSFQVPAWIQTIWNVRHLGSFGLTHFLFDCAIVNKSLTICPLLISLIPSHIKILEEINANRKECFGNLWLIFCSSSTETMVNTLHMGCVRVCCGCPLRRPGKTLLRKTAPSKKDKETDEISMPCIL